MQKRTALLVIGWIVISLCYGNWLAYANQFPDLDYSVYESYYNVLEEIANDSFDDQVSRLDEFLHNNPPFYQVYLTLLERYTAEDQIAVAKTYFTATKQTADYRNSQWMLAKIYTIQDSVENALAAFTEAFRGKNTPNLFLLYDFFYSNYQNSNQFKRYASEVKRYLSLPYENIAEAIVNLKNQAYVEALEILNRLPTEFDENLIVTQMIGTCKYMMARYVEAEVQWSKSLKMSRDLGDKHSECIFLIRLGMIKSATSQYDKAIEYYESSNKIADNLNDLLIKEKVKGNLARVILLQRNYEEVLELYDQALNISLSIANYDDAALWNFNKARTLNLLKRYGEALNAMEISSIYAVKANNNRLSMSIKIEKGNILLTLGLNKLAIKDYQEVIELAKKYGRAGVYYRAYTYIGAFRIQENKYEQARQIFLEALNLENIRPVNRAYCKWQIAYSYELEKDYDKAINGYVQAFNIASKINYDDYSGYTPWLMAEVRLSIADIEAARGNLAKAEKIYNEDFISKVAIENTQVRINLNRGLGSLARSQNKFEEAIAFYLAAVSDIEKGREELTTDQFRIGFFSEETIVYTALIHLYLNRYESTGNISDLNNLFYYIEMSRARSLRDLRLRSKSDIEELKKTPGYQEYLEVAQVLKKIQREVRANPDTLQEKNEIARYNLLSKRLQVINTVGDTSKTQAIPLDVVIEKLNRNDTGLLLYHISDEVSFVLAASGEQLQVVRLDVKPASLTATIDSLLSPFHIVAENSIHSVPFRASIAYQLYESLIKPVEDRLSLQERLLIVPDLALKELPFEMLLFEPPESIVFVPGDYPSYADKFLVNRYSFIYSPTTWLSNKGSNSASKDPNILVLANPVSSEPGSQDSTLSNYRGGWRTTVLWFAEPEADNIKSIHANTKIYKRDSATKTIFQQEASKHRILHFATHAFVDTLFDAFSGLVLATTEDKFDDGLLMGYEISDLYLDSDLITLSACETGRGEKVAGEGVLGLPRLFLGAGAKQVLMTLWKVGDKFTSELMPDFYNNFLNKNLTTSDALSQSKRDVLKIIIKENDFYYEHPFFWAAFTLYGDLGVKRDSNYLVYGIILVAFLILILMIFKRTLNLKSN